MMFEDFQEARRLMVERQLRRHGIDDGRVLAAFESIPRHLFVPAGYRVSAYEDLPLPIGFRQTISQPFITAYMTQALGLAGSERVLEVGTGSGYQAAILSKLAAEVHTVELIPALAERAAQTLSDLGITNVFVHLADGSLGWPEAAPYDAILVSAAAPYVPQSLLDQIAPHGRMILPVGKTRKQTLEFWSRHGHSFSHETLLPVAFVPLRGREGM